MAKKVNNTKVGKASIIDKYTFVRDYKDLSIIKLTKLVGVSRSAYYKWLKYGRKKDSFNEKLKLLIIECYEEIKGIYGRLKVKEWLDENYGIKVNHKRVYRLMNELGLKSVIRKKRFIRRYKSPEVVRENIFSRDFKAENLNEKWSIDVSYIPISNNRFRYLFAIKDLFNNEIVGYSIEKRQSLGQVKETLKKALKGRDYSNLTIHSDQGFQFTHKGYINFLEDRGIKVSHSRRGNCLDNAPIECFFSHLKSEFKHLYSPKTDKEIVEAVEKYIEFYNNKRIQLKLKGQSPVKYRTLAS